MLPVLVTFQWMAFLDQSYRHIQAPGNPQDALIVNQMLKETRPLLLQRLWVFLRRLRNTSTLNHWFAGGQH